MSTCDSNEKNNKQKKNNKTKQNKKQNSDISRTDVQMLKIKKKKCQKCCDLKAPSAE